ncbi:unnamed protein product [Pylaiella littoralis]
MHVMMMLHSTQHSVYYHTAAVVYSSIVNCSKIPIRPHGMIPGTSGHVSRWTNTKCKIQNTKVLPHMCESSAVVYTNAMPVCTSGPKYRNTNNREQHPTVS